MDGIRVLDLTHSWAGPHGTRILADLGAEVIKIEYLPRLCLLRAGIIKDQMYNKRPMWFQVNRGKRSLTLNLNIPQELEAFRDLVRISDVVVENARGGVLERHGLDYQGLVKVKSDIILLSMAAFGKTGPYAVYAGYGATMEAMSGAESLTGYRNATETKRVREVDVTNGIFGAAAALTALHYRRNTGKGQWIDLSQLETVSHGLIGEHLLAFAMGGIVPPLRGNRHGRFAPCGCYPCVGEDRWVTLVIRNDREWQALSELLGQANMPEDPRLMTVAGRMDCHDEIDRAIAAWTSTREAVEVQAILQRLGIAAGAVMNVEDLSRDPHLAAREFFVNTSDGGDELYPGNPIRLTKGLCPLAWRGPDLGRDNEYVLCSLLGRSRADLPQIREEDLGTALDP